METVSGGRSKEKIEQLRQEGEEIYKRQLELIEKGRKVADSDGISLDQQLEFMRETRKLLSSRKNYERHLKGGK